MSGLALGVTTIGTAAATQFLLARRAGFSVGENIAYNTASVIATLVTTVQFNTMLESHYTSRIGYPPSNGSYPDAKAKVDKIKGERKLLEFSAILLAAHTVGWVTGSLVSALFKYNPQNMTKAMTCNLASFGIYTLLLFAAKKLE